MKTTLSCADGKIWPQVLHVPTSCSCSPCVGSPAEEQQGLHQEDLSQISQTAQGLTQENQQNQLEELGMFAQQLSQEQEPISQVLQRQGRGDMIPRNSGGKK